MTDVRHDLKRVLDLKDTLALAFGAMVGWSWVILSGTWIDNGGSLGAVLGFVLAGLPIMLMGLLYAELASAMPVVGGEHAYSLRALGRPGAFVCTWAIVFVYGSVCAFEAVALPTVVEYWFPGYPVGYLWTVAGWDVYASWAVVGMIGAAAVTAINYVGVKTSAVVQATVSLLILAAGLLLLSGALFEGAPGNLQPLFHNGLAGIFAVAVMAPFMFVGFDVIPQAAEEIHLPARSIGRVLVGSIAMALAWYALVILAVALLVPAAGPRGGASGGLVTADAAAAAWGPVGGHLLVLGGVGGIITSWNAFLVGGSRAIYAMAAHGMLPAWLGRLHPKYRTPGNAILALGLLTMAAPFFGRVLLVWIVDAGSFAVVIAYLLVAVSFLRLRRAEPAMPRPFRLAHGEAIGWLALLGSLGLLALYLPGSPSALLWPIEWGLVLLWFVLGLGFYAWARRANARSR
ncbi:MAG: APC family permease [Xanthomonadales bacterium]|nr:APC family permease [Xanthomonadales bacterium]